MEARNIAPKESNEDGPVSGDPKSKLGIIGLVLGILGSAIYWASLFIVFFIVAGGGRLDIMNFPSEELNFVMYGGLFLSVVGGILGALGLVREENIVASAISLTLGALALCTGILLMLLA